MFGEKRMQTELSKPALLNWDSVIHKGAFTKDRRPLGYIVAEDEVSSSATIYPRGLLSFVNAPLCITLSQFSKAGLDNSVCISSHQTYPLEIDY